MKAVSGKEFCRIIQQHGWVLVRYSGSHHVYEKDNVPRHVSVPVHRNTSLKIGMLRRLLKDAGLTEADL